MNVIADQNELNRLAALQQYQIVETPPEETFDAIARLAAQICQTPVAVINFIDDRLQWFKAHIGLEITHMPPKIGLCSRCIHLRDGLVIPDTLADEQSRSNPVVNNYPYVRFYAGVPLIVPGEYSIGTLCVVDYKPRELKSEQLEALRLLSHQVVNQLEIRRNSLAEKAYFQTNSHLQINTHSGILTPVATQVEEIEISSMRTSQQIKTEVEQTLGFFPPFFSSALGNPHVFENLWQQTLSAYLNNPLSPIFKEKLSAYLSRYCSVPYCMIVHSSSLRPLGVEAREVLALLQASPPEETEINKHLQVLQAQPDLQTNLPAENSAIEESLLYCAIFIAVAKEEAEFYKFELRRLLGNINYQHLITFIAYVKTCHEWMEAYPEVMYEEDQRAINYLEPLISEEPGLAEFFGNYVEQVKIERQTLATRLAQLEERKRNEQALRRSEEKFRSLVEQTNDWVWEIDANAAFTYVSPQVQKIVGYEPADLIGKTTFDLMSVSESERFLLVIGEFLSKQAPFINLEKTLIHKNGNLVVLETSGSPMFDAQGVLLGYRGIARDVTERKRSEEALRRSEQRTRILNEAIPQQVWTARPNGSLDYVNKRVLDYFERSFEEMIDGGWQSVIHPEDLPGCVEVWGKSLTTGEPYEIEFRLFKASVATYRWHLGRAVPIYDEDGRIVSWFGTNTDIHDRKLAEEERDRFFSLSLDNLAIANFDGYFTRLNPAWEETTGYTTEELLAQPYLNFVDTDDRTVTTAESEKLVNNNPTKYFENRYRCKDGSLKWLAWKSVAVVEAGLVYAIARDITPKKLAEQERQELLQREQAARAEAEATRNRINNILESITDAFFAVDEQWKFTYVNHQAEVLLQRKREELLDKSIWDEFSHAVNSRFEHNYKKVVSERVSVTFEEFYPPLNTWFEVYAYPSRDGMSVYFKDITERKQAQAELQLQNRRAQLFSEISLKIRQSLQLEEILETTVTEVKRILQADRVLVYKFWADGTGSAIAESVSPQWSSILEKTFPSEVFPEEYRELYSNGRIRAISDVSNGEIAPCLTDFVQTFNVKAKLVVPIILNGQLWGLLIAHQCEHTRQWSSFETELLEQLANQISIALAQSELLEQETRQRLELMRSNEELQQFAYIASHDLQEPLRKIQAFGDRLKVKYSNVLNEQGIDYLERMQSAAQRMQVLINDLLSLSRVTTKVQRFGTVDLNKVVQEVLSDLEIRIQQTKGRVEVAKLPTIDADPLQMRQLIQNLISNALKFHSEEEAPVIKIYSQSINNHIQPPSNFSPVSDTYEIVVEDNGIGFDEKYLDRIFNVFQRLHSRSEYEGTGMGLAICRKIVEQHNGSITAKSQLGQGAKFIVTLPSIATKGEKNIEGATTSHHINGG